MTQPLFSILIANYNNGRFFKDCYDSIIAQTYQNWEAIIVDDASTDNSVKTMKTIVGEDSRFKFFKNEKNNGCGYTKRKCAELPSGEICGFLDPDDAITETAIEEMVKKHTELPEVGLIYSNFIYCDENLGEKNVHQQESVENGSADFFNFKGHISHFATFKKEFYQKTEGIDAYLQRAVDQDLYLKLYEVGKVFFVDRHFYKYRIHDTGISTNKNVRKANFWHWMVVFAAAKRRNIVIEDIFLSYFPDFSRQKAVENELAQYNKSIIFKVLRKIGLFKLF